MQVVLRAATLLAAWALGTAPAAAAPPPSGRMVPRDATGAPTAAPHYPTAGAKALQPKLQARLDAYRDLVAVGLNTDRLAAAGIDSDNYARAVLELAGAVRRREIPGGVLYVDSFGGDTMPTAIGYRVVAPEKHPAEWNTQYDVGDLTGAVVVVPLVLRALDRKSLSLSTRINEVLPDWRESPAGDVTVEMLLRHASGLPVSLDVPPDVRTREALLAMVRRLPLAEPPGMRVHRSPLNFLVLGLMLERVEGRPPFLAAADVYLRSAEMVNSGYEMPAPNRQNIAPGPFVPWLGHVAWAESPDPSAYILGTAAGHGGFISTVDDLGSFARWTMASLAGRNDVISTTTLELSLRPSPELIGGEHQGLGWMLGGLGDGSFGWDSPNGCSLWVQPGNACLAVLLSNRNHPEAESVQNPDPRGALFKWVRKSLPPPMPLTPAIPASGPTPTPAAKPEGHT